MAKENILITLRSSNVEDFEFVKNLTREVMKPYVEQTWPSDKEREDYYQLNEHCDHNTKIIELNGKRIGRVTVIEEPEVFVLDEIHILANHQGKGIGRTLISQILDEAKKRKKCVELKVLKANPALRLYKDLGFKIVKDADERFSMRYDV